MSKEALNRTLQYRMASFYACCCWQCVCVCVCMHTGSYVTMLIPNMCCVFIHTGSYVTWLINTRLCCLLTNVMPLASWAKQDGKHHYYIIIIKLSFSHTHGFTGLDPSSCGFDPSPMALTPPHGFDHSSMVLTPPHGLDPSPMV